MNALLFLSSDDFSIENGTRGPVLSHSVKGFSLIFFYSTQCVHCQSFIPIFKRLPGTIGGCQFGMINVSKNKDVIRMSRDTIAPITYVPYICLYINGKPFIRYDGPHDEGELRRFVLEVATKVQNKDKFAAQGTPQTPSHPNIKDNDKGIPAYTIGKPVCEEGVCYLDFEEAYTK
jgi:thioredoxin-like negative regulator of GroEL